MALVLVTYWFAVELMYKIVFVFIGCELLFYRFCILVHNYHKIFKHTINTDKLTFNLNI